MSDFNVPVVLLLFRRREASLRIVDRIRAVKPMRIYLVSDEGRNATERREVAAVRRAVEDAIDWECQVIKNYATSNRGVYNNIAGGAKWVFEKESEAIFLEDDNLPEVTFFRYCAELLDRYREDTRVLWICGTNYLEKTSTSGNASYAFTQNLLPCGWASWGHKFTRHYDDSFRLMADKTLASRIKWEYPNTALYRQELQCIKSEMDRAESGQRYLSWDYHMAWSIRSQNLYGIVPMHNQIRNIGVDEIAVHGGTSFSREMTRRFCGMGSNPMSFPLQHPSTVLIDRHLEKDLARVILWPLFPRLKARLRGRIGEVTGIGSEVSITGKLRTLLRRRLSRQAREEC